MAKRRMFSIEVVESDAFCVLPCSAQVLYFHLAMSADDDGFVDKWKSILRYLKVKTAMLDLLIDMGYVIEFSNEVLLIADWLRHNRIRADRYEKSQYNYLLDTLDRHPSGRYYKPSATFLATKGSVG